MSKIKKIFDKLFNNHVFNNHESERKSIYQSFLCDIDMKNIKMNGYSAFSKEAFSQNAIAYRAIMMIVQSAASVPWKLYRINNKERVEIKNHPLLDILHKPNPLLAGAEFFENIYAHKIISGNAYIMAMISKTNNYPSELHMLRPDRVTVVTGENSMPSAYKYNVDNKEKIFPVNKVTGKSHILHLRNFHPLNDWYGLSALEAAALSIDQHNLSNIWNKSLLQNGAKPSGAIVCTTARPMYDEEFLKLRTQIDEVFSGATNAGRPLLLEGGLDWKELSLSPKDMDYLETKNSAARDIALALGVPPQLLAIPGDNTYSNLQEARLALWEETILPFLDHIIDSLNNWLVPMYGDNLHLSYNVDEISGLSMRREKIWSRIEKANFLTINEKRMMIGLSPIENGDKINVFLKED